MARAFAHGAMGHRIDPSWWKLKSGFKTYKSVVLLIKSYSIQIENVSGKWQCSLVKRIKPNTKTNNNKQ